MRTYERNGVHVDQCAECRGIFLDRGELERLVDAENSWHGGGAPHTPPSAPPSSASSSQQSYGQPSYGQPGPGQQAGSLGAVVSEVLGQVRGSSGHSSSSGHKRKKQSFLGELFG